MRNLQSRAALFAAALVTVGALRAQVANHTFYWTTDNSPISSLNTHDACENPVTITVETFDNNTNLPINHGIYSLDPTAMQIPFASLSPTLAIRVLITFSTPVLSPRLAVSDLDYDHPYSTNPLPPADEWLSDFSAGFNSALQPYSSFPLPSWTGSQIVPTSGKNQACWLLWEGCHDSISFVYHRPSDLSILLNEIEYKCACDVCRDCECHGTVEVLDMPSQTNEDGQLGVVLQLTSGTDLRQVNVSVPWWDMANGADCIDCGAHPATEDGHIYNPSTLAGESPMFVGPPGIAHSGEVTYCIDPMANLNEPIGLRIRFPEVLDLDCCKPEVNYCIKVQFIDKDCKFCEFLVCRTGEGIVYKEKPRPTAPEQLAPKNASGALQVFPNPTNGSMQAAVPKALIGAAYTVLDQGGRVVLQGTAATDQLRLDVSALPVGLYTLLLRNAAEEASASFAVKR